jgi:pseudouridine synthase
MLLAFNKPYGVLCQFTDRSTPPRPTLARFGLPAQVYPAGRLDHDSEGLLLLTDDGALAHRLTHPSFEVPRTYHAKVRRAPVREDALQALRAGVELDDGRTAPARVKRLAPDRVEITIHEGRKRQVRRMLEAVGHPVISLERVRFGPLWLGKLEEGKHRRLTAVEIEKLRSGADEADRASRRQHGRRQRGGRDPARHRGADG